MFNSPWIRKPNFTEIVELDYDDYWLCRGFMINKTLKPRERIILKEIPANSSVIDIGCGNSLLPLKLKEKGCRVDIADVSRVVIREYEKLGIHGQTFDLERTYKWNLSKHYDFIILSEVLEHTRNPEAIVNKLKQYTDRFIMTVPNSAAYQFRIGLLFGGRFFTQWVKHPSEHLRYWSHIDFLDWLNALNLIVEKTPVSDGFSFRGRLPFLPGIWKNLLGFRMVYVSKVKKEADISFPRICWFGIYDRTYPRNHVLFEGLKLNGVEVMECNENAYDKHRYRKLIKKLRSFRGKYDVIYCAFPAIVPAIIAKILFQKKVVMDALYSMYDAVVNDRKEIACYHPRALKLLFLDWLSIFLADLVVADTNEHIKYWSKWPLINPDKFVRVFVGADNKEVYREDINKEGKLFIVYFHGSFIPVHGIEVILRAAKILEREQIIFKIMGKGQTYEKNIRLAKGLELKNLDIIPLRPIPKDQLRSCISNADICLGSFGNVKRLNRVIPCKIFEYAACGAAIVTSDSTGMRELFTDGDNVIFCKQNDPEDLASKILLLKNDNNLCRKIGNNAFILYKKELTPEKIAIGLLDKISSI